MCRMNYFKTFTQRYLLNARLFVFFMCRFQSGRLLQLVCSLVRHIRGLAAATANHQRLMLLKGLSSFTYSVPRKHKRFKSHTPVLAAPGGLKSLCGVCIPIVQGLCLLQCGDHTCIYQMRSDSPQKTRCICVVTCRFCIQVVSIKK